MFFKKRYKLTALTDEELVSRYKREEDSRYAGELFNRHTDLAFLVSMKYLKNEDLAKDAVMQVFERLLKDLKRYEVRNFKYWLHTVVKNQCLAILDKNTKQRERGEEWKKNTQSDVESEPKFALLNEKTVEHKRVESLEQAIEFLKADQKECIKLFYLKQRSYKEVSDMTGFSLKEVKSHIQNGKRNLKNHILKSEKGQ